MTLSSSLIVCVNVVYCNFCVACTRLSHIIIYCMNISIYSFV